MTTHDLIEMAVDEGIAPDDVFAIEDFICGYLNSQKDMADIVHQMLNKCIQ